MMSRVSTTGRTARIAGLLAGAVLWGHGTSAAQESTTVVWPVGYANKPGNSAMATPLSVAKSTRLHTTRVMTSIRGSTLPVSRGQSITRIAWRRDAMHSQSYSGVSGHLRIRMGVVPDALDLSGSFKDAWESSAVEVVRRRAYSVSSAGAPGSGRAAPFLPPIEFDTPFVYEGGDIAVEIEFTGPAGAVWRRDAVQLPAGSSATSRTYATGCRLSNGFVPGISADLGTAVPGGVLRARVDRVPWPSSRAQIAMLWLGSAIPPISLRALGLPADCAMHVSPIHISFALLGDKSTQFSSATFAIRVPTDRGLAGKSIGIQGFVADSGAVSNAPVAVSDAIAVRIGTAAPNPPRYGRTVWRYGHGEWWGPAGGMVSPDDYVPVLQFTVQP